MSVKDTMKPSDRGPTSVTHLRIKMPLNVEVVCPQASHTKGSAWLIGAVL